MDSGIEPLKDEYETDGTDSRARFSNSIVKVGVNYEKVSGVPQIGLAGNHAQGVGKGKLTLTVRRKELYSLKMDYFLFFSFLF